MVEMEGDPLSPRIICKRREPVALDAVFPVIFKASLDGGEALAKVEIVLQEDLFSWVLIQNVFYRVKIR